MEEYNCIPQEIREQFEKLSIDLTWTYGRWILFQQLYMHSEERIGLINDSAPAFFYIVRKILMDDIAMALCRLSDKSGGKNKQNLCLRAIAEEIGHIDGASRFAGQMCSDVELFVKQCGPFMAQRHKRIAHRDFEIAVQKGAQVLPRANVKMLGDALQTGAKILNKLEHHYCGSETDYKDFGMLGDADSLIYKLAEGLRYEELKREQKIHWSDFGNSKWKDAIGRKDS
jgi:hypothetical protein